MHFDIKIQKLMQTKIPIWVLSLAKWATTPPINPNPKLYDPKIAQLHWVQLQTWKTAWKITKWEGMRWHIILGAPTFG